MTPRLFKTNIRDIFTTNCLEKANTSAKTEVTLTHLTVGDVVAPTKTNGYLKKCDSGATTDDTVMKWQVVKLTTMPDGQAAVKLMRIL